MKLAFLFPGQGSQTVGMGRTLAQETPAAREAFEIADEVLGPLEGGRTLSRLCWEGPEEELKKTLNAQPALLAHSVAALRVMESRGHRPAIAAGHSLGEYSACVAAGALDFADALRLVRRRGELMHGAGTERPGTMAAILGLDVAQVDLACAEARGAGLEVVAANYNAPGQIVISGDVAAVERACEIAREKGAKRAIMLPVSGAFHSALMEPAAAKLAEAIDAVTVRDPIGPIVSNVEAREIRTADAVRAALKRQLTHPVLWESSMRHLLAWKPDFIVELGAGRVLGGLLKTLDPGSVPRSLHLGEARDIEAVMVRLESARQPAGKEIR
jgi:[acyl-carrier-protein] S-malonyltransferase